MVNYRKNKNELLVLTGAVYCFVAYLTAFALEILFIIDLAKRSSNLMATTLNSPTSTTVEQSTTSNTFDQARLALESMQTHLTVSCLAISVLYFVIFVASLILIVAIILRSTFFLLIWMCTMATMYMPEFVLILYVSIYGWGLGTRNGQTEILFFAFRAILNVIFVIRAHKLYKDWNYEKNFFRLKSNSLTPSASNHLPPISRFNPTAGYDSPYFIGDSLSTTINPVFSATVGGGSTLNLDRYDAIRDNLAGSPTFSDFEGNSFEGRNRKLADMYNPRGFYYQPKQPRDLDSQRILQNPSKSSFSANANPLHHYRLRSSSVLSINDHDEFADYEMDLDYRTLTNQRHYNRQQHDQDLNHRQLPQPPVQGRRQHQQQYSQQAKPTGSGTLNRSPAGCYSTQSLDRRHLDEMDFTKPEQVILRPLRHQPFEYLHRPGSNSNLHDLNTQPAAVTGTSYLSGARSANAKSRGHF